jgi:hypothetical protein
MILSACPEDGRAEPANESWNFELLQLPGCLPQFVV